jgi:hypothetical protein
MPSCSQVESVRSPSTATKSVKRPIGPNTCYVRRPLCIGIMIGMLHDVLFCGAFRHPSQFLSSLFPRSLSITTATMQVLRGNVRPKYRQEAWVTLSGKETLHRTCGKPHNTSHFFHLPNGWMRIASDLNLPRCYHTIIISDPKINFKKHTKNVISSYKYQSLSGQLATSGKPLYRLSAFSLHKK